MMQTEPGVFSRTLRRIVYRLPLSPFEIEPVVIMSLADYNAMEETAYLTRSPENARRLDAALRRVRKGESHPRQLIEEADE